MKKQVSVLIALLALVLTFGACQPNSGPVATQNHTMSHDTEQNAQQHADHAASSERQAEVAEKGAEVMPFDLDATTHIFEKNDEGGLQQVIADNPDDAEQIALIRAHLAEEATRFQQGDFHDPAMIHGDDMAGLHALMMGADQIEIAYSDLPNGAQILYTTTDTALIDAIHSWFDMQLADHGAHATDQR